ncbi:MAG: sugar ABC transporter substrate-binding protein [Caldilineaceae bacterium]|nr:sugar ABC transporter substrate-binding protein [Caldilineaceae bacterium]
MTDTQISRRSFLRGASAVVATLAVAACAPATQQAPAASGSEGAAPASEVITLLFHTRLGAHADWHKARKPLFDEQNPGLVLELDELPGDEMYAKVYALAASGTVGDLCWTYLNNPPEHKAKGVMIPLNDIIEAKNFDLSPFWKSLLDALTLDGELHAMPNHGHYGTTVYYHNKDLFEAAGADLPTPDWTVDDLVTAAQAITNAPETWGFRGTGTGQEHIPNYLRMFGGELLNPEGTRCLITEENSLAALRWLNDLQFVHQVDPCTCGDQQRENFVAGTVGMFNTTPGLVAEFQKVTDWTFAWDAMVVPAGPDGLHGSQVSAGAFCITGGSKHPSEAFQVLDFFSTFEDGVEHVFGGAGSPGGRTDVWASDRLAEISPIYKIIAETFPDGPAPWYRPANARASEFIDTMNNSLQAIWTGQVGFDEGIEQTYMLCQEVLDKDPI